MNVIPICFKHPVDACPRCSCMIIACEVGEVSMIVLGISVKVDIAWTEGVLAGMYLTDGRMVMRPMCSEVALKVDPGVDDVIMKFSLSSRVVCRPCCRVQYFEIIDS